MLTGSGWKVFIKRGQGGGDLGVLGFWASNAGGWLLTRLVPVPPLQMAICYFILFFGCCCSSNYRELGTDDQ